MGAPVVKVEIEFTAGSWTDVSTYVKMSNAITMTAGRSDTDERVQPGRLSGLVLRNNDGRFTVGNTSGAYYPNVTSGKQVRVSIQDPVSTTYMPRFTGRIDGWPLSWGVNGTPCTVTISATDMLGELANESRTAELFARYLFDYVVTERAHWPMASRRNDGSHAPDLGTTGNLHPTATVPVVDGSAGPFGDPRTFHGVGNCGWMATVSSVTLTSWQAGVMFRMAAPADTSILRLDGGGNNIDVRATASGYLRIAANGVTESTGGVSICDGQWWWISVGHSTTGSGNIVAIAERLDAPGTNYTSATFTAPTSAEGLTNGATSRLMTLTAANGACLGHAWWAGSSSAAYIVSGRSGGPQSISYGLAYGLPTQYPDPWATSCDSIYGLPVTVSGSDPHILGYRAPVGSVLDLWGHLDAVDGGVTFADTSGTVRHYGGTVRTSAPTLAVTVGADEVNSGMGVAPDSLRVVNSVGVVAQSVGKEVARLHMEDAASIAVRGQRRLDVTIQGYYNWGGVLTDDYRLLEPIASRLLTPVEAPRIPTLPLDPLTMSNAQQAAVLAADMWDLVSVTGLPTAGGWVSNWLGRIEGWSETVGAAQWDITFNTSFAGARVGDATFGVVGTMRLG
jgi:hypothetical protein